MRAAQITRLDGPDAIEVNDIEPPSREGVVIDVRAAGVAFPEVLQSRGLYQLKPDLPFVPGAEVAGTVAKEYAAMLPHLESGALSPIVGATYPLDEVAQAVASLETRSVTGKVVVTP